MMLLDGILVLILLMSLLSGYRKGLLMSLCTLLILVLCCLGASAARQMLTPQAAAYFEPILTTQVEQQLQQNLETKTQEMLGTAGDTQFVVDGNTVTVGELVEMLRLIGVDVEETVTNAASDASAPAITAAAETIARQVVTPLAGAVIYCGAFLVLYLLLHSVALVVNLVDRLPVIHTLNRVGGGLMGLAGGVLLLTMGALVLGQTGMQMTLGPVGSLFVDLAEGMLK